MDTAAASTTTDAPAFTATRRAWVAALLAVSLACNLAVLVLPFMNVRVGLSTTPYSLLNSISMMWSTGLYVLAVLVVGFSVVFPFAKLGILAWVCSGRVVCERRHRWLAAVEKLGKWSMLDVFLVCLILALTSGQIFVGAEPLIGIPVFVVAILLSMIAGEVLSAALPHASAPVPARPGAFARAGGWIALSGLALGGAVGLPFLRIRDWLLADNSYSIVTLVPTLAREGAWLPAALAAAFLIAAPLAAWVAACVWWWRLRRDRPADSAHRLMMACRRWSMIDVFGLALAIFLVEGEYLMKTEIRWGALALVALLALQRLAQAALDRSFTHA